MPPNKGLTVLMAEPTVLPTLLTALPAPELSPLLIKPFAALPAGPNNPRPSLPKFSLVKAC